MTPRALVLAAGVALGAAALAAGEGDGEILLETIDAEVTLADPGGRPLNAAPAGEAFRLRLALRDRLSGEPPPTQRLSAFLEQPGEDRLACADRLRAYRATGAPARGDLDLTGLVILSLGEDGRLSFVDPRLNLASSNLLALASLPSKPTTLAADPSDVAAYLASSENGKLYRVAVGRAAELIADGLAAPSQILATRAGVFVHEANAGCIRLFDRAGASVRDYLDPAGFDGFVAQEGAPLLLRGRSSGASASREGAQIVDAESGRVIATLHAPPAFRPSAVSLFAGVLVSRPLAGDMARAAVQFLDAPQEARFVALANRAEALFVSPDGAFLLALSKSEKALSIVDLASLRLIQAAAFDEAVETILFSNGAAFLQFSGRSAVAVAALSSFKSGAVFSARRIDLGRAGEPADDAGLFVKLADFPGALAAGPDPRNLFIIQDGDLHGNAPLSSLRLRAEAPRALASVNRAFRETTPGVYETAALAPRGGSYRLVVTAGVNRFSGCFDVAVAPAPGEVPALAPPRLRLAPGQAAARAGDTARLVFFAENLGEDETIETLLASSLETHWRAVASASQSNGEGGRRFSEIILGAIDASAEPQIAIATLTIDPLTDTPSVLRRHAEALGASARWRFLTGEPADLYPMLERLGVVYGGDDHPPLFFVLRAGRAVRLEGLPTAQALIDTAARLAASDAASAGP